MTTEPTPRNGVVAATLDEVETLLRRHLDDVSALIAGFLADLQAATAAREMTMMRQSFNPERCHEHGRIADSGLGWVQDEAEANRDSRKLFFAMHAGQRVRHTYEIIEPDAARGDTDRPPPPPVFQPSDVEFDEANARSLDRMTGAMRGITSSRPPPPDNEEPAEPPAPHSDTDPTPGVLRAFAMLTPGQRREAVKGAGGLPTYEKPEELRWEEKASVDPDAEQEPAVGDEVVP